MEIRPFCLAGLILGIFILFVPAEGRSAEKIKMGSAIGTSAHYYLLFAATEEQGLWKKNNLDVQWFPLRGAADVYRALAAKSLEIGMTGTVSGFQAISRGVPAIMFCAYIAKYPNNFYVLRDSPIKEPRGLKGARIGIVRFGGMNYAYGLAAVKALGLEKEVRWVATGGDRETVAALKTGVIDAMVRTLPAVITLQVAGEIRPVVAVEDYLPKEWSEAAGFVRRDFMASSPDGLKRAAQAMSQAGDFIMAHPDWAIKAVMKGLGFSEEAAREAYRHVTVVKGGKIDKKAVENVRDFLIEYEIVKRDKMPPLEQLYTAEFVK